MKESRVRKTLDDSVGKKRDEGMWKQVLCITRRKVNMCLTDAAYIGRGGRGSIHPIQLRAKDRKHEAKGGSRGLWAVGRRDGW